MRYPEGRPSRSGFRAVAGVSTFAVSVENSSERLEEPPLTPKSAGLISDTHASAHEQEERCYQSSTVRTMHNGATHLFFSRQRIIFLTSGSSKCDRQALRARA